MRVDVRVVGLEPAAVLRSHALRRIHFHLSRFGPELTTVLMRLSDTNGPKGGNDKRCQVTVYGRGFPAVAIEELHADVMAVLDLALARAGRSIGRQLERTRLARPTWRRRQDELSTL